MEKGNLKNRNNPDPYEDSLRLKELDPYETLIKKYLIPKQTKEILE